jgi:hypothetical protein
MCSTAETEDREYSFQGTEQCGSQQLEVLGILEFQGLFCPDDHPGFERTAFPEDTDAWKVRGPEKGTRVRLLEGTD